MNEGVTLAPTCLLGGNEDNISPVVPSAGIQLEPAPVVSTSIACFTVPGAKSTSLLEMGSDESETALVVGSLPGQCDDYFSRHGKYFFEDGNITFLVNGFLYCVHRYLFSRDSEYFSTRLAQLGVRAHEALSTIVLLPDVECEDFEAFLSVLYPE
ncbi:hypothetical protein EI94DRAFT_1721091 [Lactarius quietus]|nr:hypothetical protein EI94DRAFT_1721091 [Lactarius quietus]